MDQSPLPPPTLSASSASTQTEGHKTYNVGTLKYTLKGLTILFLWLLWGDFAYSFFESVLGRFIPLYLREVHASNSLIGIMTGSFAGVVNILFLPNISQWSDNYRSRWGRRIPFLYIVTPLVVGSLVAVGFAPEIAEWSYTAIFRHLSPSLTVGTLILVLLCAFMVSFHFFNMVLVNAYNWLLRDVVPQEVMARFLSWFRIIGSISSALFLWLVFPYILSHRREVCACVGLFYLVVFLIMCHNVKEGEYPEPEPVDQRPGILKSFVIYFRECLKIPFYRNFFIGYVVALLGTSCAGSFTMLFTSETLGLNMDDMGTIFAWGSVVSAVAYFPLGWICDKVSPLHVSIAAIVGQLIAALSYYFFVTGKTSYFVASIMFTIPGVAWGLGSQAMAMELFPEEKFGQFSSGLNVFGCGALIFGNYLIGQYMDFVHSNYRMVYLWSAVFAVAALFPMILVYRGWKQHGGPHNYVAPLP
ncbi:MAG: MFS transporter [Chthoniobacteraceae bacterium]